MICLRKVSFSSCISIAIANEPIDAWHYIPGGTPDLSAEVIEKGMAENCPLGRCALPEDVARVVAFLASQDGGWINGKQDELLMTETVLINYQVKSSPSLVVRHSRWS